MTVLARLDRLPWSSHQRRIVCTLALCFAFELADINTFAYAAPAVRSYLGISVRDISLITSAGFTGMFLGATFGGRLAERFGRRRSLRAAVLCFSVFSLLNAVCTSAGTLLAARFATGTGLGAMTVVAVTYLAELVPAAQRGRYSRCCSGLPNRCTGSGTPMDWWAESRAARLGCTVLTSISALPL